MENRLTIDYHPTDTFASEYDWININLDGTRVGKARCKINGKVLIIYSINIFPEFEGNGYGKEFIEISKQSFNEIIADRVRHTAIGFWEKMDFFSVGDGNWVYKKK